MELVSQVKWIFTDSGYRFGADKIRAVMTERSTKISRQTIAKIMRELGLQSIRTNAKSKYKKRKRQMKENLVKQQFHVARPNEVWISDITYFKVRGAPIYLCTVTDLFSRRVVGYKISGNSSTQLVTSTFKTAFTERGCPDNLIFHSDRGAQYVSNAFTRLLKRNGVRQSFSAAGTPYDNAVAETFFATFKQEEAYLREYSSEKSFRLSVDQYIEFYNETRPHRTLG